MAGGYAGKILRVDLSNNSITIEEPDETFYRRYIGGAGFIAYYLLKEVPPGVDPLSPENKLIFAIGPITGTAVQGGSRNCLGGKSPLTGGFGKAEVGGYWPAELKRAGFDALIVEGKAERPVYLWVHDGEAEIRDASHLWGLPTKEAQEAIRRELGDRLIRTALIGPAGENRVLFASVINDVAGHSAARGGLAAVVGAKNLKGIAVRGRKAPAIADPARLNSFVRWMADPKNTLARHPVTHVYGSGAAMSAYTHVYGNMPVRNFTDSLFEEADNISAVTLKETIRVGMDSCYACSVRCKKVVEAEDPWRIDRAYGGPEYEALAALGSTCGVGNLLAVCKANEICNAYGMDAISCGVTVAFAMECFEREILTARDLGGIQLRFGNAEGMLQLMEMIARREGIGDLLADGARRAAQRIGKGAEELAMHVKGLEIPMHEPRTQRGLGVTYAVNAIGADHCSGFMDIIATDPVWSRDVQALGHYESLPMDDLGPAKVAMARAWHLWHLFQDCALQCLFTRWEPPEVIDIIRAITGWNYTEVEALQAGERVANLGRAFNLREGITPDQDQLPKRFFGPTLRGVHSSGGLDPEAFRRAIDTWYFMMGWTPEGIPTREKMAELEVSWAADELNLPSIAQGRGTHSQG